MKLKMVPNTRVQYNRVPFKESGTKQLKNAYYKNIKIPFLVGLSFFPIVNKLSQGLPGQEKTNVRLSVFGCPVLMIVY